MSIFLKAGSEEEIVSNGDTYPAMWGQQWSRKSLPVHATSRARSGNLSGVPESRDSANGVDEASAFLIGQNDRNAGGPTTPYERLARKLVTQRMQLIQQQRRRSLRNEQTQDTT